jgi:hypothetical protein
MPGEAIATWRNKSGLGGLDPPARIKHAILADLATWAETTFGGLQRQVESEAAYVLQGIQFDAMKEKTSRGGAK